MSPFRRGRALLLGVALLGFVSLGLPDGTLGVAWPSIRATFGVPLSQLGSLLAAAMVGYLLSSACAGWLVGRLGVGPLLAWSSVLMVINSWGYALASTWSAMVGCAVLAGLGAGAIDAGINAFAAARFPAGIVTWLHASYGVGATLGPLLMTGILSSGLSWRWGYGILGLSLAGMAVAFALTLDLWYVPRATTSGYAEGRVTPRAHASLWPGVLMFFVYTGLEATAGQWSYTLLTEGRGLPSATAGTAAAGYWAGLTAGRVLAGALTSRVHPHLLLRGALILAPVAGVVVWLANGAMLAIAGLFVLGAMLAPIYPLLTADTPRRVGAERSTRAIGFQVSAAYLGTAAIPGAVGIIAAWHTLDVVAPALIVLSLMLVALYEVTRSTEEGRLTRCLRPSITRHHT